MLTSCGICGQLLVHILSEYLFTFQKAKKTPKHGASLFYNVISLCCLGLWIYFIALQWRLSGLTFCF